MADGFAPPNLGLGLAQLAMQIPQSFREAQQRDVLARMAAEGSDLDLTRAGRTLIGMGQIDAGVNLYRLGAEDRRLAQESEALRQFGGAVGGMFSGGSPAGASQSGPAASTGGAGGDYFSTVRGAESGGNPNARNPRSSATGLYQFTDDTWRGLVNSPEGRQAGLTMDGRSNPQQQEAAMRIFTAGNTAALRAAGQDPTPGNLYMAHFLGRTGGPAFLGALQRSPDAPAVSAVGAGVPQANPTVFFRPDGSPRTVREVYDLMTRRFGNVASVVPPAAPVASAPLPPIAAPVQVAAAGTTATDAVPPPAPQGAPAPPPAAPTAPGAAPLPPERPGPAPLPNTPQAAVGANITQLIQASLNPRLPQGARETARTLLEAALRNTQMTDLQREYVMARAQGYAGTLQQFDIERRTASATRVNQSVDQRGATAEETARANARAARFTTMANDADQAQQDLYVAERLSQAINLVEPGARTAALEAIRQRFGVSLDPNADNVQALDSLINYLGPRMRVPGSGATSDYEGRQFMAALPSLRGTPGGNELIAQTVGGLIRHRLDRANIAIDYQNGEIDAAEATRRIRALPNPFETFRRWQEGNSRRQGGGSTPRQTQPPRGQSTGAPTSGEVGGIRWRVD